MAIVVVVRGVTLVLNAKIEPLKSLIESKLKIPALVPLALLKIICESVLPPLIVVALELKSCVPAPLNTRFTFALSPRVALPLSLEVCVAIDSKYEARLESVLFQLPALLLNTALSVFWLVVVPVGLLIVKFVTLVPARVKLILEVAGF